MDLRIEADRLRLDVLAVALCRALRDADVPHVLIKGPSTSLWLYDPPRPYSDVDLLVPLSQARRAAVVLEDAGLAASRSGRIGEEAPHSFLLHSPEGFEVDLHISLPSVPVDGDRLWDALAPHVEPLTMDTGTVPALDEVGRCLVLALHAVGGAATGQPGDDLVRARRISGPDVWAQVDSVASDLGVQDLVDAGIARVEGRTRPLSRRAELYVREAPPAALGLQRLVEAPLRHLPRLIWQELFPSRGFMSHANADADLTGRALLAAYVRRWRYLIRQLPEALKARRTPY